MSLLSPCESCTTFSATDNYSNKVFNTYLATRLSQSEPDNEELVLYHEERQTHVKISSVLNLVKSCSVEIREADLTINHLIAYIAYNQEKLNISTQAYVNQIVLVHCGRRYGFQHHQESPKLLSLPNWNVSKMFHLSIRSYTGDNVYRFFNLENYLLESTRIKVSWASRLKSSFKTAIKKDTTHSTHTHGVEKKTYRRERGRNFYMEATMMY